MPDPGLSRCLEIIPDMPTSHVSLTATSLQVILVLKYDEPSKMILFRSWYQTRPGPKYQFSPWSISQSPLSALRTSYQGTNLFH
jgi:hypothetical protein